MAASRQHPSGCGGGPVFDLLAPLYMYSPKHITAQCQVHVRSFVLCDFVERSLTSVSTHFWRLHCHNRRRFPSVHFSRNVDHELTVNLTPRRTNVNSFASGVSTLHQSHEFPLQPETGSSPRIFSFSR